MLRVSGAVVSECVVAAGTDFVQPFTQHQRRTREIFLIIFGAGVQTASGILKKWVWKLRPPSDLWVWVMSRVNQLLVLHDVLLRLPPRGGRRGRSVVPSRFAAWAAGDFGAVVRWWERDRAAAKHPVYSDEKPIDDRKVQRALFLLQEGHLSKACKLLTSQGLGDLADARVVEQLGQKHPHRKEAIPETSEDFCTLSATARVTGADVSPTAALRRHWRQRISEWISDRTNRALRRWARH